MEKTTQKALRRMICDGIAINANSMEPEQLPRNVEKIAISYGIYGMNGGLFRDCETGELYVITARNTNLFRIF